MPRSSTTSGPALVVLAVLGVMAALHLMRMILVPVALAVLLACALAPAATRLRRWLPVSPMGASLLLFLLLAAGGLYLASQAAGSLVQAGNALPGELSLMSDRLDDGLEKMIQEQPYLKRVLPEPGTVTRLTYQGRLDLIARFRDGLIDRLGDLGAIVAQGFIVLVLALFLLAESEMLSAKVIRFFARGPGDEASTLLAIRALAREVRIYLLARTAINLGMGMVVALVLWLLGVRYPIALGTFAAVTNYVPYIGQVVGGALPVLMTLVHAGSLADGLGDALIVASAYLAVVTIAEYLVVPYILGRSLDLNGTTVLLACLLWGFLWGLVGLILAIPLTVSLKLVLQHVPGLRRWADLMSRDRTRKRPRAETAQPAQEGPAPRPIGGELKTNAAETAST